MAFKPSLRRRRSEEEIQLNLLPVMNLMVCLIPLLLSVAQFTELSLLEYLPPAAAEEGGGGGAGDEPGKEEQTAINLVLNLTESAIQVSLYNKVEPGPYFYEIPALPNGEYDLKRLADSLWSIKQREVGTSIGVDSTFNETTREWEVYPVYKVRDGRELSITALAETRFQTVINVMDACRSYTVQGPEGARSEELFPVTLLKQFQ